MKNILNNKVAVITGASGGIGTEIAKKLANFGANIVLFGGRNEAKLLKLNQELLSLSVKTLVLCGDITDLNFIKTAKEKTLKTFNKVDILINNAGIAHHSKIDEVDEKLFDDILLTNVKAPYFITQAFLPELKKSNFATIINIASIVGHLGYESQSVYTLSKHALLGFSKTLSKEVYKDGVRVHVISPGGVNTDMIKLTRPDLDGSNMISAIDVAETVNFLLQNRNGAVIDEIIMHRDGKEPFMV